MDCGRAARSVRETDLPGRSFLGLAQRGWAAFRRPIIHATYYGKEALMLCLSRRLGEEIRLATANGPICIVVNRSGRGKVELAFDAPPEVTIVRGELIRKIPDLRPLPTATA